MKDVNVGLLDSCNWAFYLGWNNQGQCEQKDQEGDGEERQSKNLQFWDRLQENSN
jgi:hypothetical protein